MQFFTTIVCALASTFAAASDGDEGGGGGLLRASEKDHGVGFAAEVVDVSDELRKGLAKFHSKTYQQKKTKYLRSEEHQDMKANYLRENYRDSEMNGKFASIPAGDSHEWSPARGSEFDSTAQCYTPVKYQDSGCCLVDTCQNYGCLVNKGAVDDHTPCDPTGERTGTPSWVYCAETGCEDSHTCSDCWCGKLDYLQNFFVNYDLDHNVLYYAFSTEALVTQVGCLGCGSAGDIDARHDFMETQLQTAECLPQFDGTAHNGMRCTSDEYCKSGRCSRGLTCEDKLGNGYSCWSDDDCNSGRCSRGLTCEDKLRNGRSCWNHDDCQSNRCRWRWWSGYTCA